MILIPKRVSLQNCFGITKITNDFLSDFSVDNAPLNQIIICVTFDVLLANECHNKLLGILIYKFGCVFYTK